MKSGIPPAVMISIIVRSSNDIKETVSPSHILDLSIMFCVIKKGNEKKNTLQSGRYKRKFSNQSKNGSMVTLSPEKKRAVLNLVYIQLRKQ